MFSTCSQSTIFWVCEKAKSNEELQFFADGQEEFENTIERNKDATDLKFCVENFILLLLGKTENMNVHNERKQLVDAAYFSFPHISRLRG